MKWGGEYTWGAILIKVEYKSSWERQWVPGESKSTQNKIILSPKRAGILGGKSILPFGPSRGIGIKKGGLRERTHAVYLPEKQRREKEEGEPIRKSGRAAWSGKEEGQKVNPRGGRENLSRKEGQSVRGRGKGGPVGQSIVI